MENPIAQWRKNRHLSCTQVSVASGIARSSVYAMENGSATRIHPKMVALIEAVDGESVAHRLQEDWKIWLGTQRKAVTQVLMSS